MDNIVCIPYKTCILINNTGRTSIEKMKPNYIFSMQKKHFQLTQNLVHGYSVSADLMLHFLGCDWSALKIFAPGDK